MQRLVREQASHAELLERQLELQRMAHTRELNRLMSIHQLEMKKALVLLLASQRR